MTNRDNVAIISALWNTYTVPVDPMSEWTPSVGDTVTIGDSGQVVPASPDASPFTIVQTISDNAVQIAPQAPQAPPLNLDLNPPDYTFAPVFPHMVGDKHRQSEPPAKDEVDLTSEELDLIAYALDSLDENGVATTFGLSVEEADEFLNQVYKKIKD